MARTKHKDVSEALGAGSLGGNWTDRVNNGKGISLEPFIKTATVIVDRVVTMAGRKGITLSAAELERIECLLAAHFYCLTDALYTQRSTQSASGGFQRAQPDKGFCSTDYGQQAVAMDYSYCLANLNSQQRAGFGWLGKPASAQVPIDDRN